MNEKLFRTVEFDKVRELVAALTSFSAGQANALNAAPTDDLYTARLWQAQTAEAIRLLGARDDIVLGGARDVRVSAENTSRGFILSGEQLLEIRGTLTAARTLKRQLTKVRDAYPHLADIADLIDDIPGLIDTITKTIDERGDVQDSASPKLGKIRQQLRVVHNRIQEKLRGIINGTLNQYLQEPLITIRAGRYVVPLRAEHKGRIKGIIHDQSSSGQTLWIEPLSTVDFNNEYRTLHLDEEKEVERILAQLSGQIAEFAEPIMRVVERLAELDHIFARARYGMRCSGIAPQFVEWRKPDLSSGHPGSTIDIRGARHPLLDPHTVVPTHFELDDDIFIVLITGPNTGGKTVSLKNIALMVLMAQSGLHLPADEARLTLFDHIFADIGDEQSIEQSLSTFSAHITNIIQLLDQVDERSLVVLDELGSGTDPSEGAALAQAITNYLKDKGATTFIATHYPELKFYASQTPGATNASMIFDVETLSPTYEMTIGIPGKSNAVAIARRLGLDESILVDALQMLGRGDADTTALIDSIYELRDKISADEAATRISRRRSELLEADLKRKLDGIELERKQLLEQAKADAMAELDAVHSEIRRARSRIRDVNSMTQLKKLSQEMKAVEAQAEQAEVEPLERPEFRPKRAPNAPFQVGDHVYVKSLKTVGEILSISGKQAEIAIGRLHTRAKFTDLELRKRTLPEPEEAGLPSTPIVSHVNMELDLRGNRVEEGLSKLDQYLDSADLANLPWVRIIHGKGTGRLRQAVRKALGHSPYVISWSEGKEGEGGAGVTVAKLQPDAPAAVS